MGFPNSAATFFCTSMMISALRSFSVNWPTCRRSFWFSSARGLRSDRGPRFRGFRASRTPARRSRRQLTRCEEYKPSRRRSAPTPPGVVAALSASCRMRCLYSAVKVRRLALATTSGSGRDADVGAAPASAAASLSSRHDGLPRRASHRTGLADHASGSLDEYSEDQAKLVRDLLRRVRLPPKVVQGCPVGVEPRIRICPGHPRTITAMPDSAPTVGGSGCLTGRSTLFHQVTVEEASPLLLMNDNCPQPSPQVCIKFAEFRCTFLGAEPEVSHPTPAIFV